MPLDPTVINGALDSGATPTELETYFVNDLKISPEESHRAIVDAALPAIEGMLGGSNDSWGEMSTYLKDKKNFSDAYISSIGSRLGIDAAAYTQTTGQQAEEPIGTNIPLGELNTEYDLSESIAYARSLGRMSGSFPTLIRGGWSADTQAQVKQNTIELNTHIVKALRSQGVDALYDPELDELYRTAQDGTRIAIDSNFIDELDANISETVGSIAGAIKGLEFGMATQKYIPPLGPFGLAARIAYVGAAGMVGGAIGAASGRGIDIVRLRSLTEAKDRLDIQKTMQQMFNAGMDDATFSVALAGVFKLGGAAASKAYRFVSKGDVKGGEKELRSIIGLDETIISDAIEAYTKHTSKSVIRTEAEQNIEGIIYNTQGGEALVAAAITHSPKARGNLLEGISKRARDTREAVSKLTSDDVLINVKNSLNEYRNAVNENYYQIEDIANVAMNKANYVADYGNVLSRLSSRSQDKIFGLLDKSGLNRDFSGLLDLRKKAGKLSEVTDKKVKKEILRSVDREITAAAVKHFPDARAWLTTWRDANIKHAEMAALEKNVLYKVLTKKGITPKGAVDAFSSLITSPDKTFSEVMAVIPMKHRIEVEGAVLDRMVKNHTVNAGEDISAIHFPKLANSLKSMDFSTPNALSMKKAIDFSAEWARNDVNLMKVTGDVSEPTMATRLFNSPAIRLKLGIYSSAFSLVRSRLGGKSGRLQSAIRTVADVLENPRNPKLIKDFTEEFDDPALINQIKQLAIHNAQYGDLNLTTPKVVLYATGKSNKTGWGDIAEETTESVAKVKEPSSRVKKSITGDTKQSASSQLLTETLGVKTHRSIMKTLGKRTLAKRDKGTFSYTSEAAAKRAGGKVKQIEIYPHRIASTEEVRELLGLTLDTEITKDMLDNPYLQESLDEIYIGVKNGEVVKIFD